MEEIWKPIVGYKGLYEVSNLGRVKSVRKCTNTWAGRILKQNTKKYARVSLLKGNQKSLVSVHRLVAEAFLGPCPPGHMTNHRNGNKLDNRIENLEWVTPSENSKHSVEILGNKPPRGEAHGMAKLTKEQVIEIRRLYMTGSYSQNRLAKMFKISQWHVYSIIHYKYWKCA